MFVFSGTGCGREGPQPGELEKGAGERGGKVKDESIDPGFSQELFETCFV